LAEHIGGFSPSRKFKALLFVATRGPTLGRHCRQSFVLRLGFLGQSQRFQTCGLFASGASLNFIFGRRRSTIPRTVLLLLETSFWLLSGLF